MDRLEKIIKIMMNEYSNTCGELQECERCIYYNGGCNLDYLMEMLLKCDKAIQKEPSITLKNIDLSEVTLEQQINKVIEERTELFDALNNGASCNSVLTNSTKISFNFSFISDFA